VTYLATDCCFGEVAL